MESPENFGQDVTNSHLIREAFSRFVTETNKPKGGDEGHGWQCCPPLGILPAPPATRFLYKTYFTKMSHLAAASLVNCPTVFRTQISEKDTAAMY